MLRTVLQIPTLPLLLLLTRLLIITKKIRKFMKRILFDMMQKPNQCDMTVSFERIFFLCPIIFVQRGPTIHTCGGGGHKGTLGQNSKNVTNHFQILKCIRNFRRKIYLIIFFFDLTIYFAYAIKAHNFKDFLLNKFSSKIYFNNHSISKGSRRDIF